LDELMKLRIMIVVCINNGVKIIKLCRQRNNFIGWWYPKDS